MVFKLFNKTGDLLYKFTNKQRALDILYKLNRQGYRVEYVYQGYTVKTWWT